jgi:hypothetical protein
MLAERSGELLQAYRRGKSSLPADCQHRPNNVVDGPGQR